jgi:hypothetical protein
VNLQSTIVNGPCGDENHAFTADLGGDIDFTIKPSWGARLILTEGVSSFGDDNRQHGWKFGFGIVYRR